MKIQKKGSFSMVIVLNKDKTHLSICHSAKARKLLKKGKATIHKRFPFTIRLKEQKQIQKQEHFQLKIDPGAKTTGLAILKNQEVVWLAELHHKIGIKKKLKERSSFRRGRRKRNTRYREARFDNRKKEKGWLPPSLHARVDQTISWCNKMKTLLPINKVSLEHVKFDTQKMDNPEVSGVEYQQGELIGYEIREYLLEKWGRKCAYCETTDVPLEIEHVVAKSRGGSNRVSNLTLACRKCNEEKGSLSLKDWEEKLKKKKNKRSKTILENLSSIKQKLKKPLKEVAFMNSVRWKLVNFLQEIFNEVEFASGARTKMNRIKYSLPKEHYYDAVCIGETPETLHFKTNNVFEIKAKGRGNRYRSATDKFGFPKRKMPRTKYICGYQSGDMVKANVPKGKYKGTWIGFAAMRSSGNADIKDVHGNRLTQGTNSKYFTLLQRFDGYVYSKKQRNLEIS